MIRTALAFVKKDFLVTVSYKLNFFIQVLFVFLFVGFFYLIGEFVDTGSIPLLRQYGGDYFGFLIIGVSFAHYMTLSIHSFAGSIRDGQLTGTLEFILISPTRLPIFLISSSLWSYLFTTLIIILYLLFGISFFDLAITNANMLAAFVIFFLSMVCFVAIGIIFAAIVLLFKRGDSIFGAIGGLGLFISGLIFPPEVLPDALEKISYFIPTKYSLHGLRLAVLKGYSISALREDILVLLLFATVFLIISALTFRYALKRSKQKGSLMQY